ncbi:MAG: dTMP kinase [Thermoplasmata archaeon]|nr:dTMP kinase [Thermoplasmata archaeon]
MTRGRVGRGQLVALEGIDGAGKSTLARAIAKALRARGRTVVRTAEPADPELGRKGAAITARDPWQAALWFTLDRAIARERIERALERAEVVLQDRSFYSTLAYQGSALPPTVRRRLERLERTVAREPDLVVLVDLDPGLALARLRGRRSTASLLERPAVLRRAHRAYRRYARALRWLSVDGRQAPDANATIVVRRIGLRGR